MSKKTSGLGKGLDDLLADNAPQIKSSGIVIRRDEDKDVRISPEKQETADIINSTAYDDPDKKPQVTTVSATPDSSSTVIIHGGSTVVEKADEPHKSRSLKALFRSYNK